MGKNTSAHSGTPLSQVDLKKLREAGVIAENEIAYMHGDLLVRESADTGMRVIIEKNQLPSGLLLEASRKLLRG
tara:strand:- start:14752 stop:14973 length:222 start_codon:yes stop_codon:yes gene_type:complete